MPDDLFTDETINDPAELTADELRALDGFHTSLAPSTRDLLAPPASQLRTEPEYGAYITRILDGIPAWHSYSTPAAVVEAREALDAAIAADQAARSEFAELPAREAAERRAIGEAAVAGDADIPALTDWSRERLILLARHDVLARRTKAAAKAYQEAVRNSLSAWRAELVSAIEPARQEALRSFQGVEAAVAKFEAAKAAAHAVDVALHPDDELQTSPLPSDVAEVLGRGHGAARALSAYLSTDHPVVSGSYLRREGQQMRPPRWVREAIAQDGNASAWSQLMSIEISEGFRFTDFTCEEAKRYVPDVDSVRPRDPRSIHNGWDDGVAFLTE